MTIPLLAQKPQPVTMVLLGINIGVYLATSANVYFIAVSPFAAFTLGFSIDSSPLTAFSSMFMHGSAFHLGMNMLALYVLGNFTEKQLGRSTFLAIYFGAGISAVFFNVLIYPTDPKILLGASGAIFGLVGVASVAGDKEATALFISQPILMAATAILGILGVSFALNIGFMAHIGGFIYGYAVMRWLLKKEAARLQALDTLPLQGKRKELWTERFYR